MVKIAATAAATLALVAPANAAARTTVLVFPAGAFVYEPAPGWSDPICHRVEQRGARCAPVEYPLWNLRRAVHYVRQVAARYENPVAYGESAGGFLAGRLLAEKRVEKAVTVNAPLNLKRWEWHPNVDMDGVNRLSVTRVERPMLLFHSPKDEVVSIRLARPVVYEPTVTYMPLFGEHGDVRRARRPGIRWLTRGASR